MSDSQLTEIHALFLSSFSKMYSTPERSLSDWKLLSTVTSADLYIREESGKITSYFVINKGQDLSGIIYEYGTEKDLTELIPELTPYGNVWLGSNFVDAHEMQYQFFLATGDKRLFSEFVEKFTNGKMLIHDLNLLKQEVYFDFNEELLSLDTEDFLRGILGPGMFEEIEAEIRPIFISGLVSI